VSPDTAPFEPGERVLLLDQKGRRYLVRLRPGETFHFHGGGVPHDLILGSDEGTMVHSASGAALVCFRPRLADFVLKMPRGAQVVYPKDLAAIVMYADVYPGARVVEAGSGSGALTLALARATGPEGRVITYELRPDFRAKAVANLEAFHGKVPAWVELREGNVRDVSQTGERFDRAVLDLPEPWAVLPEISAALRPGGIVCAYLPTTVQIQALVLAMGRAAYAQIETFEILLRPWHVTDRSVRPSLRMVAHTGFVTLGRRGPDPSATATLSGRV
jgi:tRNA (adenine57-N1/adenine58-N1)-methyltransferase catalytic subunit